MLFNVLVSSYEAKFRQSGGDPDKCEGVLQAREFSKRNESATVIDWANVASNSGWLLSVLRFNWTSLTEDERVVFIRLLGKFGAHKCLLNTVAFPEKLTLREADVLEEALTSSKSFKALDRFRCERVSRVKRV